MEVRLSTENTRSLKALLLAAHADDWHALPNGSFAIPSQRNPGSFYLASANDCSCPDAKYNGGQPCKHQLAVQLSTILEAAAELDTPKRLRVVA